MKTYIGIENGSEYTIDDLRKVYIDLLNGEPKKYGSISFDEYLKEGIDNGSLRIKNLKYLVVGHTCNNRGVLIARIFNNKKDANSFLEQELNGLDYVCIKNGKCYSFISGDCVWSKPYKSIDGITRYETDSEHEVYELHEINGNYFRLVTWCDAATTSFEISNYDIDSDAYRKIIEDMHHLLLEDVDEPINVYFGNREALVDIGNDIYGWNII